MISKDTCFLLCCCCCSNSDVVNLKQFTVGYKNDFYRIFIHIFMPFLVFGLLISGSCGLGLYWATSSLNTVILASCYVSIGGICSTALIGVIVNMFPTSLR